MALNARITNPMGLHILTFDEPKESYTATMIATQFKEEFSNMGDRVGTDSYSSHYTVTK